jgi:hypothetical protein
MDLIQKGSKDNKNKVGIYCRFFGKKEMKER